MNISDITDKSIYAIITINPNKILKKINTGLSKQNDSLWKFDSKHIINIFKTINVNPSNFAPLGHLWFNSHKLPSKASFILLNNNSKYTKYPVGYKKLLKYGSGYIWKPIPPKGYVSLGLIYSKNKPSTKLVKTVKNNLVYNHNNKSTNVSQNTSMNKYNYLGNVLHKKYCINTNINNNGVSSNKKNYNWVHDDNESVDSWVTTVGKYVKLSNHHEPWYVKNNISKHHVHTSKQKEEPIAIEEKKELSKSNTNRIILYLVILIFIIFMIRFMITLSSS